MTQDFSLSERRTIYRILTLIMEADSIVNPAEAAFLDHVFEWFQLSVEEFDRMEGMDFDQLAADFATFADDKKQQAKALFVEMSECDGQVDPREAEIIGRLLP